MRRLMKSKVVILFLFATVAGDPLRECEALAGLAGLARGDGAVTSR